MSTFDTRPTETRSFGELLGDLRDQLSQLFQQERSLVQLELKRAASELGRDSAMLIAAAVVGHLALMTLIGTLCAALVALLNLGLPLGVAVWLGPLIVGLVLAAVAAGVGWAGYKRLKRAHLAPEKTAQSLREDKQWLQGKFK